MTNEDLNDELYVLTFTYLIVVILMYWGVRRLYKSALAVFRLETREKTQ